MCRKSPAVIYVYKKIRTTRKSELYEQLNDTPLTAHDYSLICDVITGLNITELSNKYFLSASRISQWKREVCEKIHAFDIANTKH